VTRVRLMGKAPDRVPELERDLVAAIQQRAKDMGAVVLVVGQRRAKGSGTTPGYPDVTLVCCGHVVLIEVKREKSDGTPGGCLNTAQRGVVMQCLDQHVTVYCIDTVEQFTELVNECRRG
jgi:hypothetical protein